MDLLMSIQNLVSRIRQDPEFEALFRHDPHRAVRMEYGDDADPAMITEIVERTKNALAAQEAEESISDVWRTV